VPFDEIIGAWKIADNGTPTGGYWGNPNYGSSPPTQ
jgi:hypothetical protein